MHCLLLALAQNVEKSSIRPYTYIKIIDFEAIQFITAVAYKTSEFSFCAIVKLYSVLQSTLSIAN